MENTYLIVKSLHIISVISWMAGLLYLPRIFVYHTKAKIGSELDTTLQVMERKLLRFIMNPAMILSFIFGFWLIHFIGFSSGGWLHAKILLVLILAGFHGFLSKCRKNFASGNNKKSDKFYRIANEVPTLLMIAIVLLVVIKPF
ncbi:MAG: putative membrane protein [Rickettsiales bacterium]|jgi:putative membrane protein